MTLTLTTYRALLTGTLTLYPYTTHTGILQEVLGATSG